MRYVIGLPKMRQKYRPMLVVFTLLLNTISSACSVSLISSRSATGEGGGSGAPVVALIVLSSGNAQLGNESSLLASSLVARVQDSSGNPLPGQAVNWTITAGDGSLSVPSSVSNGAGLVSVDLTLGTLNPTVKAEVASSLNSLNFTATVNHLPVFTGPGPWYLMSNGSIVMQSQYAASPAVGIATDSDGDPVTITAVANGARGTVSNATSSLTYTSSSATNTGTDTFSVTVSDGRGGFRTGNITVHVMTPMTWTGGVSNTWSNAAGGNWCGAINANKNGCTNTGTVPAGSDVAIIDGTCQGSNCSPTLNYAPTVGGLKIGGSSLTQGAGVITIGSSGYTQTAGTFTGFNTNIVVNGPFSATGGSFTSTSGLLDLNSSAITMGPSFNYNHGNGTARLSYYGVASVTIGSQISFNNFTIYPFGASFFDFNNSDFTVAGNYTVGVTACGSGAGTMSSGTIRVYGDVYDAGACGPAGNLLIRMVGAGGKQVNFTTGTGRISSLEIAKTGANVTLLGVINIAGSFIYTSGTLSSGSSTVIMQAWQPSSVLNLGTNTLNNLTLYMNGNIDLSGSVITVNGTLVGGHLCGSGPLYLNNGTIHAKGDISIGIAGGCGLVGSANIHIDGTGAQTLAGGTGYSIPNVTINKSAGTLTLTGAIYIWDGLTYTTGTVDAGTSTVRYVSRSFTKYFQGIGAPFYNLEVMPTYNTAVDLLATTHIATNQLTIDASDACTGTTYINNGTLQTTGNLRIGTFTSCGANGNANVVMAGTSATDTLNKDRELTWQYSDHQ
ncbi:Ig-like domain-containing protein [bacterium]|nr:Ig-like domain-containing protein [bacterium]